MRWNAFKGDAFSPIGFKFGTGLLQHAVEAGAKIQYVSFVIQNECRWFLASLRH
jgi:hypothetical protein